MNTTIATEVESPVTQGPGRRYWKIAGVLVLLHTLLDGTAFGLGLAFSLWDWVRGANSIGALFQFPVRYIILSLVMWLVPPILTASNVIALYIVNRRINGQSRPRTTWIYLATACALAFAYVAEIRIAFSGQNAPAITLALWLLAPAILVFIGIIRYRITRRHPGHCPRCDYNLTGNTSGVCPECGSAIAAAH